MDETNPQPTFRAPVLMPALVEGAFDYLVPEGTAVGALVEAKLAGRPLVGVVWQAAPEAKEVPLAKLKPISRVIENMPPLQGAFRDWLDWVSDFTLAPKGAVLSLCGLAHAAKTPKKALATQQFTIQLPALTPAQQQAADILCKMVEQAPPSPFRGEDGRGPVQGKTSPLKTTLAYAKELRRELTEAEKFLWQELRYEALGVRFRKQHPIGPYIADFACLDPKLIIELDGGQHTDAQAKRKDTARTAFLETHGFKVLRFWNSEMLQNKEAVLETIQLAIKRLSRPHPNPPPTGEGTPTRCRLQPILLDGVTGSGKTEVYFHAIAAAIAAKKQVLVLLPEIALTHQWLERFTTMFGTAPVMWHSRMTPVAKARAWQAVARGEVQVVVGARSSLFLPFANLALIVVDEEHDPSYKQEDGVLYHARDMAVVRAHFEQIPIVLVSATPSLETLENVREGKYRAVHLPERFGAAGLPTVTLVDMRNDPPERGDFLSPTVKQAMLATLARNEQVLLFLNRRGYAPLLLCRTCGHRFQCEDCSAWLVVHRKKSMEGGLAPYASLTPAASGSGWNPTHANSSAWLTCHHCDHREPMPKACPSCNADASMLAPCGPGVERIAEEARAMFAGSPVLNEPRVASHGETGVSAWREGDGSPSITVLSSDESIAPETWADIEAGKIDILVGTQMVAKGHHFPRLTLVVVVDADVGLDGADLRAGERSYQLLHQLGGRAGRGELSGTVLVQTYVPEHPVMAALVAQDRDRLMALERREREVGQWPPFGQLAAILLDGKDEATVRAAGQALARSAPDDARLRVLGPAPAPLSKLRGQYRYRLLVKATPGIHLQRTLRNWLGGQKFSGVRIKVDVNPYYFL